MRFKVLMVVDDMQHAAADIELLREKGFLVYTTTSIIVDEMIEEVKPDLVFINPTDQDSSATNLYNRMIDNLKFATLPVLYTLSEDDLYLISKKRTSTKDSKNYISDNIIDGIKVSLLSNKELESIQRPTKTVDISKNYLNKSA